MAAFDLSRWTERMPMPLPRAHCAVGIWNGRLVVAGGTYWRDDRKFWSDRFDGYEAASDRWVKLPPLPTPHGEGVCFPMRDALVVAGGGVNGRMLATAWAFRGGVWRAEKEMALPEPRRCPTVVSAEDTVFVIGGFAGPAGEDSATRTVWAWPPGLNGWKEMAPMPAPARFWPAVGTIAGKVYVAGGAKFNNGTVENLDDIIVYDPAVDRWSRAARMSSACRGASGLVVDGQFLIIGGYGSTFERRILCFDPRTGSIQESGSLPRGLGFSRFVQFEKRIYGVSGEHGDRMRAPWTPIEASETDTR
jgi:N-acetylneuraminic acid mutarotase